MPVLDAGMLCARLSIYPRGSPVPTAKAWLEAARAQLDSGISIIERFALSGGKGRPVRGD